MPKDYYVIMGLNTTASPRQIKDAYRRLAKELHPDRSGLESEPFREVQEAYNVLSDPIQRRQYDRGCSIRNSRSQAEPFNQTGFVPRRRIEPLIPESSSRYTAEGFRPSFEDLLARWWGNFDLPTRPKAPRTAIGGSGKQTIEASRNFMRAIRQEAERQRASGRLL